MHELSLAEAVLDVAIRHARGRPVHKVEVRVGHLRQSGCSTRPPAWRRRSRSTRLCARSGSRVGVLEGDVQGSFDADRLASLHVPVTQLNTGSGFGGECHLDANMVRSAMPALPLHDIDLLVIENVGNLVCPAEFRVGEDVRAMVCSVTEGEEKPIKYPLMFRACELVVINKIDLLPHLDFDLDKFLYHLDQVNPDAERMLVSARTGEGVAQWREWLLKIAQRQRAIA